VVETGPAPIAGILSQMSVHRPLGATPQTGALEFSTSTFDVRAVAPGRGLALIGLAGMVATGLLIAVATAGTDALLPETLRPVPTWLAGPFGSTSLNLLSGGVIAVMALMFACYVIAVRAADRVSPRTVLMTIAALHALVLLAPPLISTDVFSYQAYGRMGALMGISPYLQGPHAIAFDSVFPYVGAKWSYIPTAYGPVFTALSYVLAPLSIAAGVLAYKALAALASLVTVALVWNAARLRGVDPAKAGALVGLNPLIVIYGVGGGHNDLLMLAVMMTGIYLLLAHRSLVRHRERAGGVLLAIAAAIKLTGGLLLPFAVAGGAGPRAGNRRRDLVVGAGVATAALAVLSLSMFGTGELNMFRTLKKAQDMGDWRSIPAFVTSRLGLNDGSIGHVGGLLLGVCFVTIFCWLLRRSWRAEIDWIAAAGWAAMAMLITATSLLPWYVAWLMPLAALGGDRRLWRYSVVFTGVVLFIQLLGYIHNASSVGL